MSMLLERKGRLNMEDFSIGLSLELKSGEIDKLKARVNSIEVNPIKIQIDTKSIDSQINSVKKKIQSLGSEAITIGVGKNSVINVGSNASSAASSANSQLNSIKNTYAELSRLQQRINSLRVSLPKLDSSDNISQIQEIRRQLDLLTADYDELYNSAKADLSTGQIDKLSSSFEMASSKISVLNAELEDTKRNIANGISEKLSTGNLNKEISDLETSLSKLGSSGESLKENVENVKNALNNLHSAFDSNDIDNAILSYENYNRVLKETKNQIAILNQANATSNAAQQLSLDKSNFSSSIDVWMKNNISAAKLFEEELTRLKSKIDSCDKSQLANLKKEFQNITTQAKLAEASTTSLSEKISNSLSKALSGITLLYVANKGTQVFRSMYDEVLAVDNALVELKKVTNETDSTYESLLDNASSIAKEIGSTVDGVVQSTAGFSRLGYNFGDAQELAKVANTYYVVGDEVESVDAATESLISTMAAFNVEAENAMSIVDKFNAIGNTQAISSGGIGEALKRSASSLATANNTLDESIALITAANKVVQDPERIGNAFKTISMRIRGATTELEAAGLETDNMAESTADLQKEIQALTGIDIMIDKNTFKSTYQIMDELSEKWESLTDIQRASVTELLAGKLQGNVFTSIMQNFDTARETLETSLNSEGSAIKELETALDSIDKKVNQLKSAFQDLSMTILDSSFLKSGIDGITNFVELLDDIIEKVGLLPTLVGGISAVLSFKNVGELIKQFHWSITLDNEYAHEALH